MGTNTSAKDGQHSASDTPPEIAQRAVEWLLEWQSADDPDTTWQALHEWRQQHSQHERAWQQIEAINKKFNHLSSRDNATLAQTTLTATSSPNAALSRREAIKTLGLCALVGGGGWLIAQRQPWQDWQADHHTGVGEQRHIKLVDGSGITLNSDSAIKVRYGLSERRLVLLKGEVYIRTAAAATPLIVAVPQGILQPLGTRFSVRQLGQRCRVAVYQGRVRAAPQAHSQAVIVDSGQSLTFTPSQCSEPVPVSEADAAWTQGMIVANNMYLSNFIAELNRHRRGYIQCAPEIAHLPISGTYPLNRVDEVLAALPRALPVRLQMYTPYWLRIVAA
ncbi:MAG: FecR family protein [Porticoccaceae bacterium]|nr:FecR family protein [Porticoccaceae bacterium]